MTDLLTPVDRFIREQQELTAVDRFSRLHDAGLATSADSATTDWATTGSASTCSTTTSSPARAYRDLLPQVGPGPGEQYAFEVDLDSCSGCKACVSACHSLNGLDADETWRSVGLLTGSVGVGSEPVTGSVLDRPLLQTVTTVCHHCVDPACLNGCPVDAYEKDPITGIVSHLDDQCIGCSYCTLMCPYEVPVFDHDRGIVRKCDMCRDRLAEGEAPACVQGCPTEAISITVVSRVDVLAEARSTSPEAEPVSLVPSAPPSSITVPTTRYVSKEPLPASMVAADRFSLQPSHAHTPLAVMLVLTQLSVGAFVVSLLFGDRLAEGRSWSAGLALALGLAALAASVLHLGRPLHAWRAVIGIGHSWLSREIVAFGAFAVLASSDAVATWTDASPTVRTALAVGVAGVGLVGVACSACIYAATHRWWWRLARSLPLFALTGAIGGGALLLVVTAAVGLTEGADELPVTLTTAGRPLALLVLVASVAQLVGELPVLTHRHDLRLDPRREHLHRTARLLTGDLRGTFVLRMATGAIGGVLLPIIILATAASTAPSAGVALVASVGSLALVVTGELTARRLFFLAVSAPGMPGVMR